MSSTSNLNWQKYKNCKIMIGVQEYPCVAQKKDELRYGMGITVCRPSKGNNCYENNKIIRCNPAKAVSNDFAPHCNFKGKFDYYAEK